MVGWEYGPHQLGPRSNNGLIVPPGKASNLLNDHLITGLPLMSGSAQEKWFSQKHPYIQALLALLGGYIYEAYFECHVILILGKCLIKGRHRPDMTIAVDWDVKHHSKQTNEQTTLSLGFGILIAHCFV